VLYFQVHPHALHGTARRRGSHHSDLAGGPRTAGRKRSLRVPHGQETAAVLAEGITGANQQTAHHPADEGNDNRGEATVLWAEQFRLHER